MSDISINISWLDLLIMFGWPGSILGGALGAILWRKRRLVGAGLGAVLGSLVWCAMALTLKLG
jgi:hypothetical protein